MRKLRRNFLMVKKHKICIHVPCSAMQMRHNGSSLTVRQDCLPSPILQRRIFATVPGALNAHRSRAMR